MQDKSSSLNLKTKEEMDLSIDNFILMMFGQNFLNEFGLQMRETFRYTMISMIYSHRHEKGDRFLKEIMDAGHSLNFQILRDVMYKYSKKVQDQLLAQTIESFLFVKFADHAEAEAFITEKSKDTQDKSARLISELKDLRD